MSHERQRVDRQENTMTLEGMKVHVAHLTDLFLQRDRNIARRTLGLTDKARDLYGIRPKPRSKISD